MSSVSGFQRRRHVYVQKRTRPHDTVNAGQFREQTTENPVQNLDNAINYLKNTSWHYKLLRDQRECHQQELNRHLSHDCLLGALLSYSLEVLKLFSPMKTRKCPQNRNVSCSRNSMAFWRIYPEGMKRALLLDRKCPTFSDISFKDWMGRCRNSTLNISGPELSQGNFTVHQLVPDMLSFWYLLLRRESLPTWSVFGSLLKKKWCYLSISQIKLQRVFWLEDFNLLE